MQSALAVLVFQKRDCIRYRAVFFAVLPGPSQYDAIAAQGQDCTVHRPRPSAPFDPHVRETFTPHNGAVCQSDLQRLLKPVGWDPNAVDQAAANERAASACVVQCGDLLVPRGAAEDRELVRRAMTAWRGCRM